MNWLKEITEENLEEQKNGTFERDDKYLDKINKTWEALRQFISNDSELVQAYKDCYNSFFPYKVPEGYDGDIG